MKGSAADILVKYLEMEVAAAASHAIPVIWVILKNNHLAMIKDVQAVSYQGRYVASSFSETDYPSLARALGGEGYRVEDPGQIKETVAKALGAEGPVVIEVPIDTGETPPMKPRMLALRRSLGLPDPMKSLFWNAIKALWKMRRE